MRRTAITVNYLHMLCLLSSKSCFNCCGTAFFEDFTLVAGVLLSSKSLLCLLGCLLACFLRRVALYAALSVLASSKVYFACGGCLAC